MDKIDPYMIHIGSGGIKWYSFFALLGFFLAFVLVVIFSKKKYKIRADLIEKTALALIPISIFGARFWYVIFNPQIVKVWTDVFAVWSGGLAIQGGIIFSSIVGFFIFWKMCDDKKDLLRYADCIFPFILIGQAFGRWGNFFNMEILGEKVSQESVANLGEIAKYLHYSFDNPETYRFPLFLMQFFMNIFALIIIVWIIPLFLNVRKYSGFLVSLYFIFAGLLRASMELKRAEVDIMRDSLGTPSSFVLALFFLIMGLFMLGILSLSYYRKGDICYSWKEIKYLFSRNYKFNKQS